MKPGFAVVAAVAAVVVPPNASAAPPHTVSPGQIERDLIAGRAVVEDNATIHGDVNLLRYPGKFEFESPFVCSRCTFFGSIDAPHAVFEREIDLSGSTITGSLNLHEALFEKPVLFKGTVFRGNADFAFTTFNDLAFFRDARFDADAQFTSAQFHSVTRFGDAAFGKGSSFEDAIFAVSVLFPRAIFTLDAGFPDALFGGVSDFRQAYFNTTASFTNANFVGRAEFGQALINQEADFSGARFGSDALFLGTAFGILRPDFGVGTPGVLFENTVARGRIDLEGARLKRSAQFNQVSADSLSFDGVRYGRSSKLLMTGVVANNVSLDLPDVRHLNAASPEERAILHSAEETAKSAGNLGLANDLHYRIQEIARGDDVWPRRILDHASYRAVAGYFVRPFRPLYWLVGLVIFAALLRAWRAPGKPDEVAHEPDKAANEPNKTVHEPDKAARRPASGEPEGVRRAWLKFAHALEYTLTRRGEVPAEPKPLRRLELTVYAVLLACFVLALANTNPTLRDMVDAIV